MLSLQFPAHGANFQSLYERFGIQVPKQVFDLSENVNALGFPSKVKESWPSLLEKISVYPHPEAEPLRTKLAEKYKIKRENVLIGNGAAELLTFFAKRFTGKKVIILHPSFSEYQSTLEAASAQVIELVVEDIVNYELPIEQIKERMEDASCLYLCNPNNPTGSLIPRKTLEELLIYGKKADCELLVDEAFMDWTDERESVIPLINQYPHLTVMRSMTKMYGIAGIRLGYLVGNEKLVHELNKCLPHWHVNGLAIAIGMTCLEEEKFRLMSIEYHQQMKRNLETFLHKYQCKFTSSVTNFLSFQLKFPDQTKDFYFFCLKNGVVLRHTENFIGMDGKWLRIGMKSKEAMKKFQQLMDEWHGK